MAITTKVRTRYIVMTLGFGLLCLVFGLWGAVDFFYTIPREQMLVDHMDLLEQARTALEKDPDRSSDESAAAFKLIKEERDKFPDNEKEVDKDQLAYVSTLNAAGRALSPRGPNESDSDYAARRNREVELAAIKVHLESYRDVERPSTFDRVVQIAYISCLLCVPYFFIGYVKAKRQRYLLDDDGTLHLPQGEWAADDIAAIDMSVWMKKSVAYVVHRDGTREMMDDYKHQNLHLIVGALAHQFYPEDWQEDARKVVEEEEADEVEVDAEADESVAAAGESAEPDEARQTEDTERPA